MRNIMDELNQIPGSHIQPDRFPRPVISTIDTFDPYTQVDYPFSAGHPGERKGWNIPSIAVTNEVVATIRNSARTRFQGIRLANKAGFHPNPTVSTLGYKVVPNMAQNIQVDASVQVQFSLNITSTFANASPFFAVFRDRVKISQEYRQQITTPHIFSLVTGAFVDSNPPKGWHTYDLRWHMDPVAGGTITSENRNRTFQVSNLRAQ